MNRLSVEEFHEAKKMPLVVVLDDVRSLYNVGSVFRTADAFRVEAIYLCGITATPNGTLKAQQEIHKTALEAIRELKARGYKLLAVEQCHGSTMLQNYAIDNQPSAVVLGNEVKGVHQEVIDECDGCLEIPQFGTKHSLNVSTTAGIIIWKFAESTL